MMSPRAAVFSAVLGATAAVPAVAVMQSPAPDTPPAVAMAVAIRAACPQVAGDSEKVARFVAIGLAESGGNSEAVGDVALEDGTWGPSVGWYQVRSLWAQDDTGGERDRTRLTDPAFNSVSACSISRGGTYWEPWSTYTNDAYQSHMAEARQAAGASMGVDVSDGVSSATVADKGCTAPGGRSLSAIADRLWCNAIVSPWLKLGARQKDQTWWKKIDSWVFGAPNAKSPTKGQPASLATTAPLSGSEGLDPGFASSLARMAAAAPGGISIKDGFRSVADQLAVGGGDPDCGVWVACVRNGVCGSMHCHGLAADLSFASSTAKAWAHDHAADYGLTFRMPWEDWHIEPIGAFEKVNGATT